MRERRIPFLDRVPVHLTLHKRKRNSANPPTYVRYLRGGLANGLCRGLLSPFDDLLDARLQPLGVAELSIPKHIDYSCLLER
jgi:hypothetical protein